MALGRNFRWLLTASGLSNLADGAFQITLPLVALGITRDPGSVRRGHGGRPSAMAAVRAPGGGVGRSPRPPAHDGAGRPRQGRDDRGVGARRGRQPRAALAAVPRRLRARRRRDDVRHGRPVDPAQRRRSWSAVRGERSALRRRADGQSVRRSADRRTHRRHHAGGCPRWQRRRLRGRRRGPVTARRPLPSESRHGAPAVAHRHRRRRPLPRSPSPLAHARHLCRYLQPGVDAPSSRCCRCTPSSPGPWGCPAAASGCSSRSSLPVRCWAHSSSIGSNAVSVAAARFAGGRDVPGERPRARPHDLGGVGRWAFLLGSAVNIGWNVITVSLRQRIVPTTYSAVTPDTGCWPGHDAARRSARRAHRGPLGSHRGVLDQRRVSALCFPIVYVVVTDKALAAAFFFFFFLFFFFFFFFFFSHTHEAAAAAAPGERATGVLRRRPAPCR